MNTSASFIPAGTPLVNGVWHLGPVDQRLSDAYHRVRAREQRIHSDQVVRDLPTSGSRTAHASEWRIRARSLRRLRKHLHDQGSALRILDIGCGNGWMSAALAADGHSVFALDAHLEELEQAARTFPDRNVTWCLGDPRDAALPAATFDIVLFAASLQYFPSLPDLFNAIVPALSPAGSVHVLDTMLYADERHKVEAQARSVAYYRSLEAPEMSFYYHAHALSELVGLGKVSELATPGGSGLLARLVRRNNPFHHVAVHPVAHRVA
jgi:2-polyprenyl-3-methyl-5-hydroxy-6-metoxy-1,4-benzoquinol methylase